MFKNEDMIKNSIVFDEELFHAFQDKSYPGGTQQYYTNARGNIEFEARLNYDISRGGSGSIYFGDNLDNQAYENWLNAITENYTKIPSSPLDMNIPGYQTYEYFLGKYSMLKGYSYSQNIQPEALFYLSTKNIAPNCTN